MNIPYIVIILFIPGLSQPHWDVLLLRLLVIEYRPSKNYQPPLQPVMQYLSGLTVFNVCIRPVYFQSILNI